MNLYEAIKKNLKEAELNINTATELLINTLNKEGSSINISTKYESHFDTQAEFYIKINHKNILFDEIIVQDETVSDAGYIFYGSIITQEKLNLYEDSSEQDIISFGKAIISAYNNILKSESPRGRIYSILNILSNLTADTIEEVKKVTSEFGITGIRVNDSLASETYQNVLSLEFTDEKLVDFDNKLKSIVGNLNETENIKDEDRLKVYKNGFEIVKDISGTTDEIEIYINDDVRFNFPIETTIKEAFEKELNSFNEKQLIKDLMEDEKFIEQYYEDDAVNIVNEYRIKLENTLKEL